MLNIVFSQTPPLTWLSGDSSARNFSFAVVDIEGELSWSDRRECCGGGLGRRAAGELLRTLPIRGQIFEGSCGSAAAASLANSSRGCTGNVSLAPGGSTLVAMARFVAVWMLGGVGCRWWLMVAADDRFFLAINE